MSPVRLPAPIDADAVEADLARAALQRAAIDAEIDRRVHRGVAAALADWRAQLVHQPHRRLLGVLHTPSAETAVGRPPPG